MAEGNGSTLSGILLKVSLGGVVLLIAGGLKLSANMATKADLEKCNVAYKADISEIKEPLWREYRSLSREVSGIGREVASINTKQELMYELLLKLQKP